MNPTLILHSNETNIMSYYANELKGIEYYVGDVTSIDKIYVGTLVDDDAQVPACTIFSGPNDALNEREIEEINGVK